MRGHRLPWPDRADFFRRVVAEGNDKVELRRTRLGEVIPTLAPQTLRRNPPSFESFQRLRPDRARRMTSRAVRREPRLAFKVQNRFGHDGPRRVSRTKKQNVVV